MRSTLPILSSLVLLGISAQGQNGVEISTFCLGY